MYRVRNYVAIVSLLSLTFSLCPASQESKDASHNRKLGPLQNFAVGCATGCGEVITFGQLCVYFKNMKQADQAVVWPKNGKELLPFIKETARRYPRGMSYDLIGMMPTTGVQVAVNSFILKNRPHGDKNFQEPTPFERLCASSAAGVAASPIAGPIELGIIHKQVYGQGMMGLLKKHGLKTLRGTGATGVRDAGFATGYLTGIQEAHNFLDNNGISARSAHVAVAIAVGAGTALITHPADTIKTVQQLDVKGSSSILRVAKNICQKDGVKGLWKGGTSRTARLTAAVNSMAWIKKNLTEKLEEANEAGHLSTESFINTESVIALVDRYNNSDLLPGPDFD